MSRQMRINLIHRKLDDQEVLVIKRSNHSSLRIYVTELCNDQSPYFSNLFYSGSNAYILNRVFIFFFGRLMPLWYLVCHLNIKSKLYYKWFFVINMRHIIGLWISETFKVKKGKHIYKRLFIFIMHMENTCNARTFFTYFNTLSTR